MPTLICTLGTDPADAALNRPVLVLRPEEVAEVATQARAQAAPTVALLLGGDGATRRTFGMSQLPALRAELGAALAAIAAPQLSSRLIAALALQHLDAACTTALELGLNLYVVLEEDGANDE